MKKTRGRVYRKTEERTIYRNRKFIGIVLGVLGLLFIAIGIIIALTVKSVIAEAILFSFGAVAVILAIVLYIKTKRHK